MPATPPCSLRVSVWRLAVDCSPSSMYVFCSLTVAYDAVNANRLATARVLLEAGASVDAVSKDGETALMVAVKVGRYLHCCTYAARQEINLPLVNLLLAKKPNLDLQNPDGNTGTSLCTKLLLNWLRIFTAAHFAGFSLSEEVFNKLTGAGANLGLKNAAGAVPELGLFSHVEYCCVIFADTVEGKANPAASPLVPPSSSSAESSVRHLPSVYPPALMSNAEASAAASRQDGCPSGRRADSGADGSSARAPRRETGRRRRRRGPRETRQGNGAELR
jgi:hypothetical protein